MKLVANIKLLRPDRDRFCCRQCGHEGPADTIAALNIRAKAAANRPNGGAYLRFFKVA